MPSLPYGVLAQRSPDYRASEWEMLDDLYEGGFRMARNATRHITRIYGETDDRYRDRITSTSYINYFGQIVDYFVASLFAQEMTVNPASDADNPLTVGSLPNDEFYELFADDCDMRGTRFPNLLRRVLATALCKRTAYVCVDLPASDNDAQSLAEEEGMGLLRAYAYELPNEHLIDWQTNDEGQLVWAILNRCVVERTDPEASRGEVREEFKVWRKRSDGVVSWELYRLTYRKDTTPKDNQEVQLVAAGETSFARIPIIKFELPTGLVVGEKIALVAREHFQRRSALNAAQNKSLVSLPVAKLGPEVSAIGGDLPSDRQQDPYRGDDPIGRFQRQGFIVIGKEDSIEFAEPKGTAYGLTDKQIDGLKDELFRVVHLMAASVGNDSNTMRRSGESKIQDRYAETVVLKALGQIVRAFAVEVYECIAEARGERVVWTAHGLETFDFDDRVDLINEAVQMDLVTIPSPTWKRAYKTDMAFRLLRNLPPQTQEVIRQEILAGVTSEVEMSALMQGDEASNAPVPPPSASDVSLPDAEDDDDAEDG